MNHYKDLNENVRSFFIVKRIEVKMMRIPVSFLKMFRSNLTDFAVACKLYSLINAHTKRNSKGFEVCIKQATIADACNCSISSVKRSLSRLEMSGIIMHKYRLEGANGNLGAYHYTLKQFDMTSEYIYMNSSKTYSARLNPKQLYVYAVFCRLICNDIARFYQSLNDLVNILNLNKSEISSLIKDLISKRLVRKQKKKTRCGDYTDNTYFVVLRMVGSIKKVEPTLNKLHNQCYNLKNKVNHSLRLYNSTDNKLCQAFWQKFCLCKGSG